MARRVVLATGLMEQRMLAVCYALAYQEWECGTPLSKCSAPSNAGHRPGGSGAPCQIMRRAELFVTIENTGRTAVARAYNASCKEGPSIIHKGAGIVIALWWVLTS